MAGETPAPLSFSILFTGSLARATEVAFCFCLAVCDLIESPFLLVKPGNDDKDDAPVWSQIAPATWQAPGPSWVPAPALARNLSLAAWQR